MIKYVKRKIKERPYAYPYIRILQGKSADKFCSKNDDMCIEGYPSSANSFTYNVFKCIGDRLAISHHTHSISNIKRALYFNVSTLVLFRDPDDAIPSRVTRFDIDLKSAVIEYRKFYRYILTQSEDVYLADFERIIESISEVVDEFSKFSGLNLEYENIEGVEKNVLNHIGNWSEKHRGHKESSLPNKKRENKKESKLTNLKSLEEYYNVKSIHEKLKKQ